MRYYEIVRRERSFTQIDPRRTLSLYAANGEYADCAAMIRCHGGEVVGVTKVPVGGMTIQVRCPTVDAALELFTSWLDRTSPSACRADHLERGAP